MLANDPVPEEIVDAIRAGGQRCEVFSSLPQILDGSALGCPTAIVHTIQRATASLSTTVSSLVSAFPDVPVVVSCSSIDGWEVRASLASGASGVLRESDMGKVLAPCLRAARSGQICVPRPFWRQTDRPALSSREHQALRLAADGYTNNEIAGRLFLSESTVKSHLSSAFGKLGVRSRHAAAELLTALERPGLPAMLGDPTPAEPPRPKRSYLIAEDR